MYILKVGLHFGLTNQKLKTYCPAPLLPLETLLSVRVWSLSSVDEIAGQFVGFAIWCLQEKGRQESREAGQPTAKRGWMGEKRGRKKMAKKANYEIMNEIYWKNIPPMADCLPRQWMIVRVGSVWRWSSELKWPPFIWTENIFFKYLCCYFFP